MSGWLTVLVVVAVLVLVGLALSVRIVQQYEKGVLFRLGRVVGVREPGMTLIVPLIEVLRRVSLRIVTMPIQSQEIITRDNVSIDVSAVAYYRVIDPVKAVVAIENVAAAINQIAQTTLRKVIAPVVMPGIAAAALICFIFSWNELLLARVLTSTVAQTAPVFLTGFVTSQGLFLAKVCAASFVVSLPVLIAGFAAQDNLVQGLSMGAVR